MSERSPYDQGWLDGADHTAKTYAGWNERDKTLNAAVDKLKATLDQSARVRALETEISEARDVMLSARPHCIHTSVEGDIDDWLARNPEKPSQSGDQIAPDTAEPAEKQPDSR